MESVQALLRAGADVNTSDADGKSPLWWAACKGHTEVMEALLTHGADVGSPDEVRASPFASPLPFVSTSGCEVRGGATRQRQRLGIGSLIYSRTVNTRA